MELIEGKVLKVCHAAGMGARGRVGRGRAVEARGVTHGCRLWSTKKYKVWNKIIYATHGQTLAQIDFKKID